MPKPILKTNLKIVDESLKLMKTNDDSIKIDFNCKDKILIKADNDK